MRWRLPWRTQVKKQRTESSRDIQWTLGFSCQCVINSTDPPGGWPGNSSHRLPFPLAEGPSLTPDHREVTLAPNVHGAGNPQGCRRPPLAAFPVCLASTSRGPVHRPQFINGVTHRSRSFHRHRLALGAVGASGSSSGRPGRPPGSPDHIAARSRLAGKALRNTCVTI